MIFFMFIAIAYLEVLSILKAFNTKRVLKNSNNFFLGTTFERSINYSSKITIILPCHKEFEHIKNTVHYFENLINDFIEVYIITGNENNESHNSYQLLKKTIQDYDSNIQLLYDTNQNSTKTTKLNYALKHLSRTNISENYLAIYDFDSRPDPRSFEWVLNDLNLSYNKKKVDIYQQTPLILKLSSNSKWVNNYYIHHIRRSLTTEGAPLFKKKKKVLYLMGSGMFINIKTLLDIGGFPQYSDDIELGLKFYSKNAFEKFIPFYTVNETVDDWKSLFNQILRIYYGYFGNAQTLKLLSIKKKIVLYFDFFYEFINLFFGCFLLFFGYVELFSIYILLTIISNNIYFTLFNNLYKEKHNKNYFSTVFKIIEPTITVFNYKLIRLFALFIFILKKDKVVNLYLKSSKKGGK